MIVFMRKTCIYCLDCLLWNNINFEKLRIKTEFTNSMQVDNNLEWNKLYIIVWKYVHIISPITYLLLVINHFIRSFAWKLHSKNIKVATWLWKLPIMIFVNPYKQQLKFNKWFITHSRWEQMIFSSEKMSYVIFSSIFQKIG